MKRKNIYIIFSIALIFIVTLVAFYSAYTFSVETDNNDETLEELENVDGLMIADVEYPEEYISYLSPTDVTEQGNNSSSYITVSGNDHILNNTPEYETQSGLTCYAISARNTLEATLLNRFQNLGYSPNSDGRFSYIHMVHALYHQFNSGNNEFGTHYWENWGGYDSDIITYLTNGLGPTLSYSSTDPYNPGNRNNVLTATKDYRIKEIKVIKGFKLPDNDNTVSYDNSTNVMKKVADIKYYLNQGYAVGISTRSLRNGCTCFKVINSTVGSSYCPILNQQYGSSCDYHQATIIGWNDEFQDFASVTGNPSMDDSIKGAWIATSSNDMYGSSGTSHPGKKIYISYYDYSITQANIVFTDIGKKNSSINDYDNLYQYHPYFQPSSVTWTDSKSKIANVFTKESNKEQLKSIGFYISKIPETTDNEITVKFYYTDKMATIIHGTEQDIYTTGTNGNYIGERTIPKSVGYYTYTLSNPIDITNSKFIVALESSVPYAFAQVNENPPDYTFTHANTTHNYFIYHPNTEFQITAGKSYEYSSSEGWIDLYQKEKKETNFIKVFTSNVSTTNTPQETAITSMNFKNETPNTIAEQNSINYTQYVNINPSSATNKSLAWKSGNKSVIKVDEKGNVRGIATGQAVLYAYATDGSGVYTQITLQVENDSPVPVTGVTLNKTTLTLNVTEHETLIATVTPSNATNQNVTWTSNKPNVATVDANGLVTAVGAGTAIITVKTEDGNHTATCNVTVQNPPLDDPLQSITINGNTEVEVGSDISLGASFTPSSPTNINITGIYWTSSNTNIATVTSPTAIPVRGIVTGVAPGQVTITVHVPKTDGGEATQSINITVIPSSNTETTYTVNHYKQNVDGGYPTTPTDTNQITLSPGAEVPTNTYPGFNSPNTVTANPNNTTINYYYSRKQYTVTLQKGVGIQNVTGGATYLYGKEVTINATLGVGYNWSGWVLTSDSSTIVSSDQEHTFTVTGNVNYTATASPVPISPVTYTVKHYKQNIDGGYPTAPTLTETGSGVVGMTIQPVPKTYEGFTTPNKESIVLSSTNNVIEYKYPRKIHTIDLIKGDGISSITIAPQKKNYLYGTKVTIKATVKDGYVWKNWTGSDTVVSRQWSFMVGDKDYTYRANATKVIAEDDITITLSQTSLTLKKGESKQIAEKITPEGSYQIEWSTSNSNVATVTNGLIKAVGLGEADIVVKTNTSSGMKQATCHVKVQNNEVSPTGITLNKTEITVLEDGTETLTAKILPEEATNKEVTWITSNTNVATVVNGKITGIKEGEAVITAKTKNNLTATCKVYVKKQEVPITEATIKLDKIKVSIVKGKEYKLNATVTGSNENVTWTSSDNNVATVNNGTIKAINKGKTIITAKINNTSAKCEVTVITDNEQKIEFSSNEYNVYINEILEPEIITTPTDMKIEKMEWIIEDKNIVSEEENKLKGLKVGETKVKVKINNKYEAETIIHVKEKPLIITIEGYDLGFNEDIREYKLEIKKEKSLNIKYNKEVEIRGNENLKNNSVIQIIDLSNQNEYNITIVKKNKAIPYFIAIIITLVALGCFLLIKKKKD